MSRHEEAIDRIQKMTDEEYETFKEIAAKGFDRSHLTHLIKNRKDDATNFEHICDVLGIKTPEERTAQATEEATQAAKESAQSAKNSAKTAWRAEMWAISAVVASVVSAIAAVGSVIVTYMQYRKM